jgi:hypothetical protein
VAAVPGQEVILTISFSDSRYTTGRKASYTLTIDGIVWDANNGCDIASVNITPTAHGMMTQCSWQGFGSDKHCFSTSVDGFLKIETKCNLPFNLGGASHILQATPTFYSIPTTLNEASAQFTTRKVSSAVGAITGNVVSVTGGNVPGITLSQGSTQFITGNAGGRTTLTQAVTKFTTAQVVGMTGLAQEFFNWVLSIFG